MSFATEGQAIRSRIATQWGSTTDIAWPNGAYIPTLGSAWIRVTIRNGESMQPYLGPGSKRRSAGVVLVEVFVPSDRFDSAVRALVDSVAAMFRNAQHDGITYREPSAREAAGQIRAEGAAGQEEPWYRWIVEIPYYRDWTP